MPVSSQKHRSHFQLATPAREAQRHAVLLSLRRSGQSEQRLRWSIAELEALAREVGIRTVYTMVQTRSHAATASVLGTGKLTALTALISGQGAEAITPQPELLLVDATLTPAQHHELRSALGVEVVDRTQLILELFALRARTRVAQLTVALAQQSQLLPRLRDDTSKHGREGGGGRGARGHTQLTLAKQRARARIAALERELRQAQQAERAQRERRQQLRRVALVGYTNAGKSSWLSALTGRATLVADKPFATLETTVRTLARRSAAPEPILISDTVGFLRDLPHAAVGSFHATLQEAAEADLCLLVADAADPNLLEQLSVTEQTLGELGAESVRVLLLNKADRLTAELRAQLAQQLPHALLVSAHVSDDVARVRRLITGHFELPE